MLTKTQNVSYPTVKGLTWLPLRRDTLKSGRQWSSSLNNSLWWDSFAQMQPEFSPMKARSLPLQKMGRWETFSASPKSLIFFCKESLPIRAAWRKGWDIQRSFTTAFNSSSDDSGVDTRSRPSKQAKTKNKVVFQEKNVLIFANFGEFLFERIALDIFSRTDLHTKNFKKQGKSYWGFCENWEIAQAPAPPAQ